MARESPKHECRQARSKRVENSIRNRRAHQLARKMQCPETARLCLMRAREPHEFVPIEIVLTDEGSRVPERPPRRTSEEM